MTAVSIKASGSRPVGSRWRSLLRKFGLSASDIHVQKSPNTDPVHAIGMIDVMNPQVDSESTDSQPDHFSVRDIDIVRVRTLARLI